MAEKKPTTTLGAIDRSLNAISPYNLLYMLLANPFIQGAQTFKQGMQTGEVPAGGGLAMAAPTMTGGLLAPVKGAAVGSGLIGKAPPPGLFDAPPVRAYHGTYRDIEQFSPKRWEGVGGVHFTPDPKVASEYAKMSVIDDAGAAQVMPVDLYFKNPKVIKNLGQRDLTEAEIAKWKREGFDGVVGVDDAGKAVEYAAITSGTVKSATTGETLYAGGGRRGAMLAPGVGLLNVPSQEAARSVRVAFRDKTGKVVVGEPGQTHADMYPLSRGLDERSTKSVFVTDEGKVLGRQEAYEYVTGKPGRPLTGERMKAMEKVRSYFPPQAQPLLEPAAGLLNVPSPAAAARFSTRNLEKPIGEMEFTRVPSGDIRRRKLISPESMQGGHMVGLVGDRMVAGQQGTSVGGYPIGVQFPGGGGYMRTPGGVWAMDAPQAKAVSNTVQRLSETGDPVYGTHAVMGPRSIDFQHGMTDQILQVLPQAEITRAGKALFNEQFKKGKIEQGKRITFEDFPGLNSPRLRAWLDEAGQRRTWFAQLMEQERFRKQGFPNIPEMRVAATEKSQLYLPDFASGAEIARLQPGLLGGTHPSFPIDTLGKYEGGLGTYLPIQTMFPDWYAANAAHAQPGSNWRRQFQLGASKAPQKLDQRWVDQAMPVWNELTGR